MIRVFSNLLENSLYQIRKNNRGKIFFTTQSNLHNYYFYLFFKDYAGGAPEKVIQELFSGYDTV